MSAEALAKVEEELNTKPRFTFHASRFTFYDMIRWPHGSVVGIDVSDRTIEAIQLKRSFGKPTVVAYSREEIPDGIVEDGRILKPTELVAQLRRLLQHANPAPIRERLCLISLPESQVFSHVFKVPPSLDRDHARRAILFEAEQFVSLPLAESYYDFYSVGVVGDAQEVNYVAARRALVHQYIEAFQQAGLTPVAFEPESSSLARALLRRGLVGRAGAVMLLDVGARTTNAHLAREHMVVGSLTIPRAGSHFTAAVAAALQLDAAAAEERKIREGLEPGRPDSTVLGAMLPVLGLIAEELKRFLEYAREHRGLLVEQVILSGGSALLPGLAEYVSAQLGIPATLGNPFARLRFGQVRIADPQAVLYSNVVGLALRGVSRDPVGSGPNLLSQARDRFREEQRQKFFTLPPMNRQVVGLVAAFVLCIGVLVGLLWYRTRQPPIPTNRYQSELPPINWEKIRSPRSQTLVFHFGSGKILPAGTMRARLLRRTFSVTQRLPAAETSSAPLANPEVMAAIRSLLREEATEYFVAQILAREFLVPMAIPLSQEEFATSIPVQTSGGQVTIKLTQNVGGLVVDEKLLTAAISQGFGNMADPLRSVSFALGDVNLEKQQISVMIQAAIPPVDNK